MSSMSLLLAPEKITEQTESPPQVSIAIPKQKGNVSSDASRNFKENLIRTETGIRDHPRRTHFENDWEPNSERKAHIITKTLT